MKATLPRGAIRDYCQRWSVCEFALFGSVLRDDFSDQSHIDVLVTFSDGVQYTLFDMVKMAEELEAILGRKVDLLTRKSVESSPNFVRRREILEAAEVIYAS